jgi:hypothetical protein
VFAGKTVLHNGKEWCSIADAARYLRTSQQAVRNMMGAELDYLQLRKNAQPCIALEDLVKVQITKMDARRPRTRSS